MDYDSNKDGSIDRREFTKAVEITEREIGNKQDIRKEMKHFRICDVNRNV